jgi:hypothetical protein
VVFKFVSMRIGDITDILGNGRDGPIYTKDRGFRRSPRRGVGQRSTTK